MQCSFVEHRNYKIIYRRYASLFFLVGVEGEEVHNFLFCAVPLSFWHQQDSCLDRSIATLIEYLCYCNS